MVHPFFNGKKQHFIRRAIDAITSMSYQSLFLLWISLAFGFGVAYFLLSNFNAAHGPNIVGEATVLNKFANSLYYSIITATSTGYGDITPQGFSKALASLQSILALFIFAIFVTKLVSHRQDIALRQIHKLSFEDMFHNIREGFYIVRKDFDHIIAEAKEHHALSDEDWANLTTAYRQAQSYLRRIPDFYDEHNRLYTIDVRREELLQDGVRRTMGRTEHMLDTLSAKHVHWVEHNESVEELRELLQVCNHILHYWREQSPHHRLTDFEDLFQINERIHEQIEHGVKKHRESQ